MAPLSRMGGAEPAALLAIAATRRTPVARGIPSLCTAHPFVLSTACEHARDSGSLVLVESTSNQVNQEGGYTGLRPADFVAFILRTAEEAGLPPGRVLLGGDHLGPYPWRSRPAAEAMSRACVMVRDYVRAGYAKVHLDASAACADDPAPLPEDVIAERAAELATVAEAAQRERSSQPPVYVIGTEVPPPGGQQGAHAGPEVTRGEDAARTIARAREAFERRGLAAAWERVVALVVQPGVEFGDDAVHRYRRQGVAPLRALAESAAGLAYEAHSTDYQDEGALRALVADRFAVLKVGPELTFALREALFGLEGVERELLQARGAAGLSRLRDTLDDAMREDPRHWESFYQGDDAELRLRRAYSLSDRARYYWTQPRLAAAVETLFANLADRALPAGLVRQYLGDAAGELAEARAHDLPRDLVRRRVRQVLDRYTRACHPAGSGVSAREESL